MGKFLDQSGLEYYDGKIKAVIKKKQDTLVSGTNIKTINGSSILGSGNLTVGGATAGVASIGGKTGAITLSGLSMVGNVLTNPATGSLAKKNSATGNSPAVECEALSGWISINGAKKATFSLNSSLPISNYEYLYFEGVDDNPSSTSESNTDCAHAFLPVELWKTYTSPKHTLSLTRDGARARIYYVSNTSIGVHVQSYINYIRVWGIKRGKTITVS